MQYTKIKKIEKVETEPIYHLTVEKNHNFLANDILVHNCDYRGQIGLIIINTSNKSFEIKDGERMGQAVLNKVEQIEWNVVSSIDELGTTVRGAGGFGHTNK